MQALDTTILSTAGRGELVAPRAQADTINFVVWSNEMKKQECIFAVGLLTSGSGPNRGSGIPSSLK